MRRARVLIVDDQPMVRLGLNLALREAPDLEVVGEMTPLDLINAVESSDSMVADIVVYGNMNCGLTSLTVPWVALRRQPNLEIVVMGSTADNDDLLNALILGVAAYVPKEMRPCHITKVVQEVANGCHPIFEMVLRRPYLATRILDLYRTMAMSDGTEIEFIERRSETRATHAKLTARELAILKYAAQGYFNKQIALLLGLSEKTVRNNVSNLLHKLEVHNRVEAVMYAIKQGLITAGIFPENSAPSPDNSGSAPGIPERPDIANWPRLRRDWALPIKPPAQYTQPATTQQTA